MVMRFALAFAALFWTVIGLLGGMPVVIVTCLLCVCGVFGLAAFVGGGE